MIELSSIDPGTKNLGFAFWVAKRLVYVSVSRTSTRDTESQIAAHVRCIVDAIGGVTREKFARWPGTCAIEYMEHRREDGRSVPNDLLAVQAVGFGVAGATSAGRVSVYPARRWKGTLPKHIHHARIRKALDANETSVLEMALARIPVHLQKEALDAIGIGLVHLGRINRAGGEIT